MKSHLSRFLLLSWLVLPASFLGAETPTPVFSIGSPAVTGKPEKGFDSGLMSSGRIDKAYVANKRSFPFTWTGLPKGTKALALILDDPDARLILKSFGQDKDAFLHWIATDIDPALGGLADNASKTASFPQGANGATSLGYTGPNPPADIPKDAKKPLIHIYRLKVYALSSPTGLKDGFSLEDLKKALEGKVLATAELDFSYNK